jgi:hypothetical protein
MQPFLRRCGGSAAGEGAGGVLGEVRDEEDGGSGTQGRANNHTTDQGEPSRLEGAAGKQRATAGRNHSLWHLQTSRHSVQGVRHTLVITLSHDIEIVATSAKQRHRVCSLRQTQRCTADQLSCPSMRCLAAASHRQACHAQVLGDRIDPPVRCKLVRGSKGSELHAWWACCMPELRTTSSR